MSELHKTLSATRGAALMLNIVVGAGLLALPGLVVSAVGDHALWAWIVCAIVAVPLLTVFIIMGQKFPNAGGIAHFSEMAFGSLAYIISSLLFLGAVSFGLPAIALTGGHYIAEIIPAHPALYAGFLIIAATTIHLASSEIAGKISTAIASVIIIALLAIIAIGLYSVEWNTVADNIAPVHEIDANLLFLPFMMIFFAFTGWEVAASISEEFKNPKKDFPKAMVLSFIAACSIYFAMAFVTQNATIDGAYEASFVSIVGTTLGDVGEIAMACLAAIIIFANLMGGIWAVSRMVFALSRSAYIPIKLNTNKNGTPISAVMMTTAILLMVLACDWLGWLNMKQMLSIAGQNFLILYGITGLALFKLTQNTIQKTIAATTIIIVITLLIIEATSILYPIALTATAIAIWYFTKRTGGNLTNRTK